jgi:hypothetical protein
MAGMATSMMEDPQKHNENIQKESEYERVAKEIGTLVKAKQEAYGNSFGRAGVVLRELYPDGIKPEQYDDMLCVVRILDKLFRIANKKSAFGENPYRDIAGYSLLGTIFLKPGSNK